MSDDSATVALAGNPNSGKTALFNALTGSRQRVGNWPGVTVDKKTGRFQQQDNVIAVVDLPGTYSISVTSQNGALDEKIACDYLSSGAADVIVNIIDATNLERNLYLTLQLLELRIPMVLAVSMMDVVEQRGIELNLKRLSNLLKCPVVGIVAKRGRGIDELKNQIIKTAMRKQASDYTLPLPSEINAAMQIISQTMQPHKVSQNSRWMAVRLLEGDHFATAKVNKHVLQTAQQQAQKIESQLEEEPDILIADARYAVAAQLAQQVTQLIKSPRQTITQWLDRVVLNRYLGIPIFLGVMYLMFLFAINVGGAFQDFFDIGSTTIFVDGFAHLLTQWHAPIWLTVILANGVGKGINTTITFVPVIGGMFLFLAFLEDSGYMARAAFIMDRLMRAVGLPGKSFVPMIVGFGCNVPAVMGARTLENRRDRILTILMMPFMSCGARLAIFAVFASAFFPTGGATIIFVLYLTGILVAVLSGFVMRKTLLKGKPAPLVMELPSYHVPRLGALNRQAWLRLKSFLTRASKVIIPVCVIIGALNAITVTGKLAHENHQQSLLSEVGRAVTPVFHPMGIDQNNWPATVGLTTGILAKEVVVGTLNTLYSEVGNLTSQEANQFNLWRGLEAAVLSVPQNLSQLGDAFKNPVAADEAPHDMNKTAYGIMFQRFGGKAAAFAYLLFVLLYFPCVATMAAMRREIGRGWAVFSVLWSTGLAYVLAVTCYQLLTLTAHPISSALWSGSLLTLLAFTVVGLRLYASGGIKGKKREPEKAGGKPEFKRDRITLRGH